MSGILKLGATKTTNPDPNSLVVTNPYPTPYVNPDVASIAWTTQAATFSPALVASGSYDSGNTISGHVRFVPDSGHPLAHYTIAAWQWDTTAKKWFLASMLESTRNIGEPSAAEDGFYAVYPPGTLAPTVLNAYQDTLVYPLLMPIFLQIVDITAGASIDIYYDSGVFSTLGGLLDIPV